MIHSLVWNSFVSDQTLYPKEGRYTKNIEYTCPFGVIYTYLFVVPLWIQVPQKTHTPFGVISTSSPTILQHKGRPTARLAHSQPILLGCDLSHAIGQSSVVDLDSIELDVENLIFIGNWVDPVVWLGFQPVNWFEGHRASEKIRCIETIWKYTSIVYLCTYKNLYM